MLATELMVDDWVLYEGEPHQIRQLGIYGVDRDGEDYPAICVGKPKGIGLILERNEIEPIPLTPEILEKIGFERCISSIIKTSTSSVPVCKSNQFANKEFGGNTRIIDMGIHGFTLITDVFGTTERNKVNHIFYVHQLQHALRLCGIEKEIIL